VSTEPSDRTDAYLRWNVRPGTVLDEWHAGGATALLQVGRTGVPTLTAVGSPGEAADLLVQVLGAGAEVGRVTLPRGTLPLLPDPLPGPLVVGEGADWDWMWTDAAPAPQPGEADVLPLPDDEHHRGLLDALLDAASPRTSVRPGDPQVRTWWGVAEAGRLVACAAHIEIVHGVPHLAGVAVLPARRGRGLGGAVTAAATRAVLDAGAPVCTLGMYADNLPARRVYARLGYRYEHAFSSRALVSPAETAAGPAHPGTV
jgi:GNAT superfamily N-acetyltransferase